MVFRPNCVPSDIPDALLAEALASDPGYNEGQTQEYLQQVLTYAKDILIIQPEDDEEKREFGAHMAMITFINDEAVTEAATQFPMNFIVTLLDETTGLEHRELCLPYLDSNIMQGHLRQLVAEKMPSLGS